MKIGALTLDNPTILAPLAGITNLPFRLIVKAAGCGLVCSEMISANGLVRHSEKTHRMLASSPADKPLSIQIFGAQPDMMADAAQMVEASGASMVDINFGCSVKKIVKTGSGVALMREPERSEALLKAVRRAVSIPLTIKIRSGWDPSGQQALRLSKIAVDCGVDAIAVHPRTATQGFGGRADWSLIARIKRGVPLPVIGNGDIFSAEDAVRMMAESGCDYVMIGRSAVANPWIFKQIVARIKGNDEPPADPALRFETMRRYLEATVEYAGEKQACLMMRSRLGWFAKGLPHSSHFREAIKRISTESEGRELIDSYARQVAAHVCEHAADCPGGHKKE